MDRTRSRYEDFLSLVTPDPKDSVDFSEGEDYSWILSMLEENTQDGIPALEPKPSECNEKSLSERENSFYSNAILDQAPSTSAANLRTEKDKDFSIGALIDLQGLPNSVENPLAPMTSRSNLDLYSDNRWSSFASRSSHLWPSQMVSCYSPLPTQVFGNIIFFIDGVGDWTPSTSMRITVLDNNNNQVPVEMSKENLPQSHRYVCTFHASTPGYYTVTVCDGLMSFHIQGSPLIIPVTRNYKMCAAWRKPQIFYSKAIKAWGIAHSSFTKRVYVADRDAHQIIVYHEDGKLDRCFGRQGNRQDELYRPTGIAVDQPNHRLIISDKDNHRISVYTLDGQFKFNFGGKGYQNGEFNYPWGVAVSPKDGSIAVADSRNHRIQIFDSCGNFLRKYSIYETNPFEFKTGFNYPRGVTFDKNGENIYVTDFNIQTVFKLNSDLTEKGILIQPGMNLCRPQGITIDVAGNLLVCDSRHNCIRVLSPQGELISSIPGHPKESFQFPQDVVITPAGDIIVVDNNSSVFVL